MIASGEALCAECFWGSVTSAFENLHDDNIDKGITIDHTDLEADARQTAIAYTWARSYLYDEGSLSACPDHIDLVG